MIENSIATFEVPDLLLQAVVAMAIGGLIGLEREKESSNKYAGLRRLALLCGSSFVMFTMLRLVDTHSCSHLFGTCAGYRIIDHLYSVYRSA